MSSMEKEAGLDAVARAGMAHFARTLLDFAGDGAQPGVALSSRYAIRPVRFSCARGLPGEPRSPASEEA